MKNLLLTAALLIFSGLIFAEDDDPITRIVNANTDQWLETFKDLHRHPELAFMETRTSGIVDKTLKSLGYNVLTGIGKTGVVGILRNGEGPTIMFRADMDANAVKEQTGLEYASSAVVKRDNGETVPVMHACGHDAHTTWLMGIARVMQETRDRWHGTLVLVAQPAEEVIEGARAMVDDGMYKKGVPAPDVLFGMHTSPTPTGTVNIEKGPRMAGTDQFDVTFHGVGGHGSTPHLTKDPILMAASAIVQYQFIISRAIDAQHAGVLTVGSVQAGSDNNVVPSSALLKINLRWYDEKDRKLMIEGIKRINKSIAEAYGLPKKLYPEIRFKGWAYPLVNDNALVDEITPALKEMLDEKAIISNAPRAMGSEDFHHLVIKNPHSRYAYMFVGVAKPSLFEAAVKQGKALPFSNHNNNFQVDLDAIPLGVRIGSTVLTRLFREEANKSDDGQSRK